MAAPEVPDWTRVVLLSGIDPSGDPITIAVDASGYIVAAMKGEYAGILKNVAVDEQGRLIMIPTDPADIWGNAISMGNAELAARLGSPSHFHRSGSVIFQDSFEHGFSKATVSGGGSGNLQEISTTHTRSLGFSAKFTGGAADPWNAYYTTEIPYLVLSKMGLEFSISHDNNLSYISCTIYLYDGTNYYQPQFKYDFVNQKVQYLDNTGEFQNLITGLNLRNQVNLFHTYKLVVDFVGKTYHAFYIDSQKAVMSTYSLFSDTALVAPRIYFEIVVVSVAGANTVAYLDDIILTQNEPT